MGLPVKHCGNKGSVRGGMPLRDGVMTAVYNQIQPTSRGVEHSHEAGMREDLPTVAIMRTRTESVAAWHRALWAARRVPGSLHQ